VDDLAQRRRFERALHDGAQQDLIALAVRLQLAQELLASDRDAAAELIEELRRDVHLTLDSLRELSAEIYPPLLDAFGLQEALRGISRIRVHDVGRHPLDLEAAVYFCCVESEAEIDLHEDDRGLRVGFRGDLPPRLRRLAEAAGATFYESAR
jgi:signal transduction histidine kinase